jgi:arginyl-tRNA synthetase
LHAAEKELVKLLGQYPAMVAEARAKLSPAVVCAYAYELATAFNKFYHDCSMLNETNETVRQFRLALAAQTAGYLCKTLDLVGIEAPERM